jgi:formamidopyrimidine-DNA glycosylase
MPELPEVEHVVRGLRQVICGRQIVAAELRLRRIAPGISRAGFDRKLRNARILGVNRRGKYILIELDSAQVLLVHLRMTGKFVCLPADQKLPAYAHVIFHLDDERSLVFCDMRQFGRIRLLPAAKLQSSPELSALAPEPFSDGFNANYLAAALSRSRQSLKQLLLNQTKVLGLGNIYASEALFLARINPLRPSDSISKQRVGRLYDAIRQILHEAIESGSTLRMDLADGIGSYFGTAERFWRVYEREGEPCVKCETPIRRIIQGARSTYYCPRCQRR